MVLEDQLSVCREAAGRLLRPYFSGELRVQHVVGTTGSESRSGRGAWG